MALKVKTESIKKGKIVISDVGQMYAYMTFGKSVVCLLTL